MPAGGDAHQWAPRVQLQAVGLLGELPSGVAPAADVERARVRGVARAVRIERHGCAHVVLAVQDRCPVLGVDPDDRQLGHDVPGSDGVAERAGAGSRSGLGPDPEPVLRELGDVVEEDGVVEAGLDRHPPGAVDPVLEVVAVGLARSGGVPGDLDPAAGERSVQPSSVRCGVRARRSRACRNECRSQDHPDERRNTSRVRLGHWSPSLDDGPAEPMSHRR